MQHFIERQSAKERNHSILFSSCFQRFRIAFTIKMLIFVHCRDAKIQTIYCDVSSNWGKSCNVYCNPVTCIHNYCTLLFRGDGGISYIKRLDWLPNTRHVDVASENSVGTFKFYCPSTLCHSFQRIFSISAQFTVAERILVLPLITLLNLSE